MRYDRYTAFGVERDVPLPVGAEVNGTYLWEYVVVHEGEVYLPVKGECICPKCGMRHGGSAANTEF